LIKVLLKYSQIRKLLTGISKSQLSFTAGLVESKGIGQVLQECVV